MRFSVYLIKESPKSSPWHSGSDLEVRKAVKKMGGLNYDEMKMRWLQLIELTRPQ